MIRIAYVINYIEKNGPSNVVLSLINNLDNSLYEITLITLFDGNNKEVVTSLRDKGITVFECKKLSRMKCLFGQSEEFISIIKNGNYDVIHTHGFIPDILSSRLRGSLKRITTIHNNMYEDYFESYGYLKSRIFVALHLRALKKLDKCICCSKSVYDVMKLQLPNVSFIRNGIEMVQAHSIVARADVDVPEDACVFLYAGMLSSGKNIVWLIENFVKYHDSNEYLLVIGSGEKNDECKEKADDHVRILGFQRDPIAYMNISDVYVSASKSEGFSISILEALGCGLGLFLSDIPSHKEIVSMKKENLNFGSIFRNDDFENKFREISMKQFDKDAIIEFQRTELSARHMTKEYEKIYRLEKL